MPAIKTDLNALASNEDLLIWLGHSYYYVQLHGKRILIDLVLSDYAPHSLFLNKAFSGATLYRMVDLPVINNLLISHDL